jgi:hypothetical protein
VEGAGHVCVDERTTILDRNAANDRRVWNDALQAVVLALACNEPDPMSPDALIDADPCIACEQMECARDLVIKRVLALKRSART